MRSIFGRNQGNQSMKQLRATLGVGIFYVAALAGSLPSQASILDIRIDNPSISAVLPASGIAEYFFTGSITNNSAHDLNFEFQEDPGQLPRGIGTPTLYGGPGRQQNPLTYRDSDGLVSFGGLIPRPLFGPCNWGTEVSSSCLLAGQTFTGAIASVIIGPDTAPRIYSLTEEGAGHPVTITFLGTYFQDGQQLPIAADSAALSVNVLSQHAVPEPQTWALLVAGLAGMVLLSRKRERRQSIPTYL